MSLDLNVSKKRNMYHYPHLKEVNDLLQLRSVQRFSKAPALHLYWGVTCILFWCSLEWFLGVNRPLQALEKFSQDKYCHFRNMVLTYLDICKHLGQKHHHCFVEGRAEWHLYLTNSEPSFCKQHLNLSDARNWPAGSKGSKQKAII